MRQHWLQLYDDSAFMVDRVVSFLKHGAQEGAGLVLIATPEHAASVERGLKGHDEHLHVRDAQTLLDTIMRGDQVDRSLFDQHVSSLFESAGRGGPVRGFGEMVALLWQAGNHDGAVRLERLWDKMSGADRYDLICAYPLQSVTEQIAGGPFLAICDGHSHVFASEQVVKPVTLQSRVNSLEREASLLRGELSRRLDVQHMLSEADETKDDFIAILSHELRNPLTPIITAVELLRHEPDPDQQQRLVATIGRQTSILARLVDDLVEGRRITTGRVSIAHEPIQLSTVIEQACETVASLVKQREQVFNVDCEACDVQVTGDSVRLTQALTNLLVNAAKFTPSQGRIDLICSREARRVIIEVRDSGRGMDPDFARRAFQPYAQATAGEGGLGLGLAIVRSIIQMHGGVVEATSPGPGLGSTFRLALPLAETDGSLQLPPHSSRVLVVDDNDDVRETLATLLNSYGHDARTAASGRDAIAQLEHRPHVVLLDLGMPEMDGFEVAKRIRATGASPLLVALSGHVPGEQALAAGFDEQLTKPPDIEQLLRLVERASQKR